MQIEVAFYISLAFAAVMLTGWILSVRAKRYYQDAYIKAASQLESAQQLRAETENLRDSYIKRYEAEKEERLAAERLAVQYRQQVESLKEQQAKELEIRKQHEEAARASILKAGAEMSSKLLEDHKREAKQQKEETEQRIRKTTEDLHRQYQTITSSVESLTQNVKDMEVVRRALLHPTGAGSLGEITLENIFKNSSLREGEDYALQYAMKGEKGNALRPDAAVFLPYDSALIIDSKASKFFIDMAQMQDGSEEKLLAEKQLKASMQQHLKSLVVRDYQYGLSKTEGKHQRTGQVSVLMFLPTEAALETMRRIDPYFMQNAQKQQINPVGPSGLVNILQLSKMHISTAQQEKNVGQIMEDVGRMVKNLATLHKYSDELGGHLERALNKYNQFSKSFNRNFVSSVYKLEHHGVHAPKNKEFYRLKQYQFITQDIEMDAVETEKPKVKQLELAEE